jgi:hypothetical protein
VPRLILLLAIGAVIYILFRRAQSMPPHKRRGELIKLGLGVAVVVVIMLTLAGKMHWVGAALTGLVVAVRQLAPSLIRLFPMLSSLRGSSTAQQGQSSTVATEFLRMHLDHDSGKLSGEVIKGEFTDWLLAEMDNQQLQALLAFCQQEDSESAQLLDSYLQQRFDGSSEFGQQQQTAQPSHTGMSRKEALDVLGLDDSASDEDVTAAHRKLMQKLHPDRGGNDYLASKINQAKDFLLG